MTPNYEILDIAFIDGSIIQESDKKIGLGLSIALEIVNEMNGTIDVQSDLKSGTKVNINVPVGPGTLHNKA